VKTIIRLIALLALAVGVCLGQGTGTRRSTAGVGSVTHTGNLTPLAVVVGNGTADEKVDTGCSTDGAGAETCTSYTTSGSNGGLSQTEGSIAHARRGR
jgi:hypothetical protein